MRRRTEPLFFAAVVLLLHLLLLWAWPRANAPRRQAPPAPSSSVVVLLPLTPPPAAPTAAATPRSEARVASRDAGPRRIAPSPPAAAAPASAETVAPIPEDVATAPDTAPLKLALPQDSAASSPQTLPQQARNDPRANTPRPTLESRIAAVAGTREWTEERMDATRTRFRKNGNCLEVHVARNAQIDPWNQNHAPTPKAVKPEC